MIFRRPSEARAGSARPAGDVAQIAHDIFVSPADVAQLVERHLAKVKVAGSRPVVRSEGAARGPPLARGGVAEWLGKGLQIPLYRFDSGRRLRRLGFGGTATGA